MGAKRAEQGQDRAGGDDLAEGRMPHLASILVVGSCSLTALRVENNREIKKKKTKQQTQKLLFPVQDQYLVSMVIAG